MKQKIHINSLPSNRPVASHDCRQCIKRRIRCDRSLPKCEKCANRRLQCPGFSHLKWDQGIASRGKLKGKMKPIFEPGEPNKNHARVDKHFIYKQAASPAVSPRCAPHGVPTTALKAVSGSSDTIYTISPPNDSRLINKHISTQTLEHLVHHFFHEVVPRFRWIDLPDNPWRTTIQPIAQDSRCLQAAMACHAAAHLSITWTGPIDMRANFRDIYHHLRDASLHLLNGRFRSDLLCESGFSKSALPPCFPIDVLASVLLLCYANAFIPDSTDWKLHLRACQIVIRSHVIHSQPPGRFSSSRAFLLKEVADLEILSNISGFNRDSHSSTEWVSQHLHSSSPWAFTELIQKITMLERRRHAFMKSQQTVPNTQLELVHQQAEEAYFKILAIISPYFQEQSARKCLETVILAHYYAVIIYSCQALGTDTERKGAVNLFLDSLQSSVQSVISSTEQQFSHDLFIPLFIIGTECRGDVQRQTIVEELFLKLLFITGMWWNHTALQFLRAFWSSGKSSDITWLQYGHENDAHVGDFMLF